MPSGFDEDNKRNITQPFESIWRFQASDELGQYHKQVHYFLVSKPQPQNHQVLGRKYCVEFLFFILLLRIVHAYVGSNRELHFTYNNVQRENTVGIFFFYFCYKETV